jgi:hypothetical protein
MKVVCRGILLRHYLNVESPAREILFPNGLVKIALVAFPIFGNNRLSFLVGQVFNTLLGFQVKLNPVPLVFRVNKTESVTTETMHVTVGIGNAPVAHDDGYLVERLR